MASTISAAIQSLLASKKFLAGLPSWDRVLVVEQENGERLPGLTPPAQFEERFRNILGQTSRDWINLSALNVSDGALVVCVEYRIDSARGPSVLSAEQISVNLSGPSAKHHRDPYERS